MNKLLFKINRTVEELKRKNNPTQEDKEFIKSLTKIKDDLLEFHNMDIQKKSIEEAQKDLILSTTRFIEDSWKVNELYEEAYKEVMLLAIRRLDNESSQRI